MQVLFTLDLKSPPYPASSPTRIVLVPITGGHLEVLKRVRVNGALWDEETTSLAAGNNQLDVLRWARENGCPWNAGSAASAAGGGASSFQRAHMACIQNHHDQLKVWYEWLLHA